MGVSSTRGTFDPEASSRMVYVRIWTFGRDEESSVAIVDVNEAGVGAREMLITCSRPAKHIESTTCPLKKSTSMDLSWMNRGWVSKSSDAK